MLEKLLWFLLTHTLLTDNVGMILTWDIWQVVQKLQAIIRFIFDKYQKVTIHSNIYSLNEILFRKCLWDVDCLWHGMQNEWSTLSALYSMHISYPNTWFFLSLTNHYESTLSRLLCPITLTSVFAKMHPIVPSWLESQVSNDWRLSSWYRTMGLKPFFKKWLIC